jgi:uncharacterized membrane protein YbhN (UPF0104 family)
MKNSTLAKIGINILLTLAIMAAILYFIDFSKLVRILMGAKLEFIALALAVYLLINALMAARIWKLLHGLGAKVGYAEVLKTQFGGMLASDVTPARSGYFFTAFSISAKHRIGLEKTMTVIFGPQLLEFFLKIVAGAAVLYLAIGKVSVIGSNSLFAALFVLAVVAGIAFFGLLMFSRRFLGLFSFAKGLPFGAKAFYFFGLMQNESPILLREIKFLLGLEVVTWLLKTLEWSLYFWALGLSVSSGDMVADFGFFLIFHALITFLQFIPLPTVAGAGTSEAAAAAVLAAFGIPIEAGVAFMFLTRGGMLFADLLGLPAILEFAKSKNIGEIFEFEKRIGKEVD